MDFSIVFKNLLGYDGLIILIGCFNGYLAYQLKKRIAALYEVLNPTMYMPIQKVIMKVHQEKTLDLHFIRGLKEKETRLFHIYASITTIFPLLGILGTIISLIRIVSMESDTLMLNFSTALTSTFWGLLGAIIFKSIGGILSGTSETNNDMLLLLFNRIDEYEYLEATHKETL